MQKNINVFSPKIDVVFKSLFSKKGNEDLLEDLLTSVLNRNVKCKEVLKEARIGQKRPDEKYGSLDIKVILDNLEEIDIEMQISDKHDTINRAIYYMSLLTSEDLKLSKSYNDMKPKIVIFFLDFNLFNYNNSLNESYICLKDHKNVELTKLQKYYFIEMPKISSMKHTTNERLKTWIAFLNQDKEMLKMSKNDKVIEKAQKELEYLTGDAEIKRLAELKQKAIRDEIATRRLGEEEGLKKGIKQGVKQGVKQGEAMSKLRIAKAFIYNGVDINLVSKCTGLTKKEIKDLSTESSKNNTKQN